MAPRRTGRPKKERRPRGFWKEHSRDIVYDLRTLGEPETKKKWRVSATVWERYLPRWRAALSHGPDDAPGIPGAPGGGCPYPCEEILMLRGFKRAVEALTPFITVPKEEPSHGRANDRPT
jgi:hypothetical protein